MPIPGRAVAYDPTNVLTKLFTPLKRDELNAVAAILDDDGHWRVVSTPIGNMPAHVAAGERLFIVPGLWKWGDIAWDDIPPVIEAVGAHVYRMTNGQHGALP